MAKTNIPQPISDVAKPGKSAPSVTSVPVLISNRPVIQDQTVGGIATAVITDPITATAPVLPPSHKSKVLQPSSELPKASPAKLLNDQTAATLAKPATKPAAVSDRPKPVAVPAATPEPETKPESIPTAQSVDAQQPVIDAEAGDRAIQKLVEAKTYFLAINAVEQRRTKRFVILGCLVSLLLAVAWVDVALDASIIHIGSLKAVTHFFSVL